MPFPWSCLAVDDIRPACTSGTGVRAGTVASPIRREAACMQANLSAKFRHSCSLAKRPAAHVHVNTTFCAPLGTAAVSLPYSFLQLLSLCCWLCQDSPSGFCLVSITCGQQLSPDTLKPEMLTGNHVTKLWSINHSTHMHACSTWSSVLAACGCCTKCHSAVSAHNEPTMSPDTRSSPRII